MKIITIIGARPQFIKAAVISRRISELNSKNSSHVIDEVIVHTGQHYDEEMSGLFFRELEIPEPKYNLEIGSGNHGYQTGKMLIALEEVLQKEEPDWVLVYGDTNSTLAGALAATKLHIPIVHVEAGLRSYNRRMPEEINRVLADQVSKLLFCPSQTAVDNLALEGIKKGVHITGDVMMEAVKFAEDKIPENPEILAQLGIKPKKYLLATVHRAENTDDIHRLKDILAAFGTIDSTIVFPVHPRTRKLLETTKYSSPENVILIDPLGYFEIITLEKNAQMILTDSGGIQKEAYWLKVPCITLREETEWVETVSNGWNVLTGADKDKIIGAVKSFKMPENHPPLYGDGSTSLYCIQKILEAKI